MLDVSGASAAALGRHVLLALPRTAGQPGGGAVARLLLHAAGGLARPGERLLAGDALLRRLAARGLGQVRRRPWRGAGRPCGCSRTRLCHVRQQHGLACAATTSAAAADAHRAWWV